MLCTRDLNFALISRLSQDATTRQALMHAYTTSISMVWLINTPILGVGLLLGASTSQYIPEGRLMII